MAVEAYAPLSRLARDQQPVSFECSSSRLPADIPICTRIFLSCDQLLQLIYVSLKLDVKALVWVTENTTYLLIQV
ncbi:Uncharacterized protein HZ326_21565 [Fusarium oxysporum f. sp. albedinis]|nr:Uncharacterized protein HZ326_21565 [Fusarium oxysporum f. sp. albedinis]